MDGEEGDLYTPDEGFFNISMAYPSGYDETYLIFIMAYNESDGKHYGAMKKLELEEDGGDIEDFNATLQPLQGEESELAYYDNTGEADDPTDYPSITTKLKRFEIVNSTGSDVHNYDARVYMDYSEHFSDSSQAIWRRSSGIHTTNSDSGYFEVPAFGRDGMYVHIFSEGFAPRNVRLTEEMLEGEGPVVIELDEFSEDNMIIDGAVPQISTSLFRGDTADTPYPQDEDGIQAMEDQHPLMVRMLFDRMLMNILGGDTSFRMTNEENNVTVHYSNVDASRSTAPDAVFDSSPGSTEGEGFEYLWRFGSTGPQIYDKVLVSMPYNETVSDNLTIHIPFLYNEEWEVVWNASENSTDDVGSHYQAYVDTDYETYLNGTGVECDQNNEDLTEGLCYKDTERSLVWFEIPHFSGVGVNTEGYAPPVSLDAVPDFDIEEKRDIEVSLSAEAFNLEEEAEDFGVVWNITAPEGSDFTEEQLDWGDAYVEKKDNNIKAYNSTSTELENWIDGDTGTLYWAVSNDDLHGNMSEWLEELSTMFIEDMEFTESATPGRWNFTMELVQINITEGDITRVGEPLGHDFKEFSVRDDEVWVNASLPEEEVNGTHFNTVQSGIEGVAGNGIVNVHEEEYSENIILQRPVDLISSGSAGKTVLRGADEELPVLILESDEVRIDGFTISESFAGLMAFGVSGLDISNNIITNITTEGMEDEDEPGMGLVLMESEASVSGNTFSKSDAGIMIADSEIDQDLPGDNIFEDNFIDYAYPSEEYFTIKFGTVHPVLNDVSLWIEGDDPGSTTSVEVLEEWNIEIQNTNITLPEGTVIDSKDGSQFPAFAINASDVDKEILEASNGIINNSLKFGISDGIGLVFSEPVTIQLNLSDLVENQNETFDIVKSQNKTGPWTQTGLIDLNCDVSEDDGTCEFQTTEASYFAVGEFEKYSLDISSTSGGVVSEPGEGTFEYVNGTVVDLKAESDSDYGFDGWVGDVDEVGDIGSSGTTLNVFDNYTITAEFKEDTRPSSGGGSIVTSPPSEPVPELPVEARSWDSITPGVVESMEIEKSEELGVKRISISVVNEANDVTITVTKQDDRPADVDVDVTGVTYRYMSIEAENLEEDNVDEATVEFDVNRSWVDEENIDPERVYLNRWVDGGWERLETDMVSEAEDKITYEARTPGFSYFAVSGEELVEEEIPDDEEEDVEDEPVDEEPPEEDSPWVWMALIIALVAVLIVFYYYRNIYMGEEEYSFGGTKTEDKKE